MSIVFESDIKENVLIKTAEKMMTAARTAYGIPLYIGSKNIFFDRK